MAQFKAFYGHQCRTPIYWDKIGEREPSKVESIDQTDDVVKTISKRLQAA